MADIWIPGYDQVDVQKDGGWYLAGTEYKFVGHMTEGLSLNPHSSFAAHPWPPQLWATPPHHPYKPKVLMQGIPLNRSGYALAHPSGTPETNNAGAIQIEIEDFSAKSPYWPQYSLDWYADEVVTPICELMGVDPRVYLETYGQDAGFIIATQYSRIRLPWDEYYDFNGLMCHQHVHSNDHWDQGKINLAHISARAAKNLGYGTTPPPTIPVPDTGYEYAQKYFILGGGK